MNLIPFPMEELFTREISTFDVVIFQNFDYYQFSPVRQGFQAYLGNIERHVRDAGGGFVMIGGEKSFDLGHYQGTAIANILPVQLRQSGRIDERSFTAEVTSAGQHHPITGMEKSETANRRQWKAMPKLHGCHLVEPGDRAKNVLLKNPLNEAPVMVTGRAGKGRTLALMTDDTWRWSFQAAGRGLGSELYVQFWRNALRWLVRDTDDAALKLSVDRRRVRPGDTVTGSVKLQDSPEDGVEDRSIQLKAHRRGAEGSTAWQRDITTNEEGLAEVELPLPSSGAWILRATAPGITLENGTTPSDETSVVVEPDGIERKRLRPNRALLETLAQKSGGELYDIVRKGVPGDVPISRAPVETLSSREVVPLWDNWFVYGLIVGCLCVEWWLRRRRGVT